MLKTELTKEFFITVSEIQQFCLKAYRECYRIWVKMRTKTHTKFRNTISLRNKIAAEYQSSYPTLLLSIQSALLYYCTTGWRIFSSIVSMETWLLPAAWEIKQ